MRRNRKRTVKIKQCKFCGKDFIVTASGQLYCSKNCASAWRALYGYHYIPNPEGKAKDTLCWECAKATGGSDCPWANYFIPVAGWDATPTKVKMGGNRAQDSYFVNECPIFERG